MRLKDRVAIVTGAASGIGAATARLFASEGAMVVIADRDADGGAQVTAGIVESGGTAHFQRADMGDGEQIDGLIESSIERFGRIDILHNNTAGASPAPLGDLEVEQWETSLTLGLTCYWRASRRALPHMVAQGKGAIVNTASISGLAADYGLGAYNVIKAGIINMTRSIALDYGTKGVRCNAVAPGLIYTPPYERMRAANPAAIEKLGQNVPLGRFGRAEEIANVVLFLASDDASFVNGAIIVADGGQTAHTGTPSIFS